MNLESMRQGATDMARKAAGAASTAASSASSALSTLSSNLQEISTMTSKSLTTGERYTLTKDDGDALTNVTTGLGWDPQKKPGGPEFDLDAFAFMCNGDRKLINDDGFVYFGNKIQTGIQHGGDNLTGNGAGIDEKIVLDLLAVPADVTCIPVGAFIFKAHDRGQNFGQVDNAFICAIDSDASSEKLRYDLTEDFSTATVVVFGEYYRHGDGWKFKALTESSTGTIEDFARSYGWKK